MINLDFRDTIMRKIAKPFALRRAKEHRVARQKQQYLLSYRATEVKNIYTRIKLSPFQNQLTRNRTWLTAVYLGFDGTVEQHIARSLILVA
jgi:hypothetical protein